MSLAGDLRVLRALAAGQRGSGSHAERLERFYAPQASDYDRFRARLLHGRQELIARLPRRPGMQVVELGAGTGCNLDLFGPSLDRIGRAWLVDLCPSLAREARRRHAQRANVTVVEADATRFRPETPVDVVYLSYSLSMIPDWRAALDNAVGMLKPGGTLAVVDFFVSAASPPEGRARHGALARALWPRWFAHDGVRLSPDTVDALLHAARPDYLSERRAAVPYLPLLRVPYFLYVGTKAGIEGPPGRTAATAPPSPREPRLVCV
jgi:S-adenosylmethionine-diacylgycerolhomoserine-N-methlytransferase